MGVPLNPSPNDPSSWYPADNCIAGKEKRGPRQKSVRKKISRELQSYNEENPNDLVDYNPKNFKLLCVYYKLDDSFAGAVWESHFETPPTWNLSDCEYNNSISEFPGALKF